MPRSSTTERRGISSVYNAWRSEERKSETQNEYQWRDKEEEGGSMVNKRSWARNRVVRIVRILCTSFDRRRRWVGVNVGVGRRRALVLGYRWRWWWWRRRRCRNHRGTWILARITSGAYDRGRRRRGGVDNLPIIHARMIRQQQKHQHG